MSTERQVLQVVSGDGDFNEDGVRQFVSAAHIDTAGVDYQTVAITGPQSSGKSTLMNALVRCIMQSSCASQALTLSCCIHASNVSLMGKCCLLFVLRE